MRLIEMYLRRVGQALLQLSTLQVIFIAAVIIAIRGLSLRPGEYHYDHIPRQEIKKNLYRARSPNLRLDPSLPQCEYGYVQDQDYIGMVEIEQRISKFSNDGITNGSYSPSDCNPLFSTAILVTYRKREHQLSKFIPYIHTFLKKQKIHYKIFVIEQHDERPWNKGVLYNVGAGVAMAESFPCLILHDVDLFPQNSANIYSCTQNPRHMSASIDKFRYVLPYKNLVGGVTAITSHHYSMINGFSNKYEGWGAEDDDFARRINYNLLLITRFQPEMSRYIMLRHRQEKVNARRLEVLRATERGHREDGLNSVRYASLATLQRPLYTLVRVEL